MNGVYTIMRKRKDFRAKAAFLGLALIASPVFSEPVAAPVLAALSGLETGQWQLRSRGGGEGTSLCVNDPRVLLQVRHPRAQCSKFVISNDPRSATVQYSCPGAGSGRTTLRVETPRLVQIDSQGIVNNEPFAMQLEGRRVGTCSSQLSLGERKTRAPALSFR